MEVVDVGNVLPLVIVQAKDSGVRAVVSHNSLDATSKARGILLQDESKGGTSHSWGLCPILITKFTCRYE
jgi:hypothetical protein